MPHRIVVVGSSCCGKTTFAKRLAALLQIPHVELDALNWGPNWQSKPPEEFRRLVTEAVSRDSWLVDGNYSFVRDLFWPHTTQVVWLNYSFPIIFRRALKRSLRRSLTGEKLYADNTETLALTFFHRESILCWIIKSFRRRAPRDQNIYPNLTSTGLRTPAAAERFLDTVSSRAELQTN